MGGFQVLKKLIFCITSRERREHPVALPVVRIFCQAIEAPLAHNELP